MVGLGFLPGDNQSYADSVNANAKVVVGLSINPVNGRNEAFRWTERRGMVGLGFLPGDPSSAAQGVDADGDFVVGDASNLSIGREQAFRWIAAKGLVGLGFLPGVASALPEVLAPMATSWLVLAVTQAGYYKLSVGRPMNPQVISEAE
jgi:uncharacterized membrane protein